MSVISGCGAVGSALPWGGRGRLFKSGHSDQYVRTAFHYCGEPFLSKYYNIRKSSDSKSELLALYYIFASFANSAFSAG